MIATTEWVHSADNSQKSSSVDPSPGYSRSASIEPPFSPPGSPPFSPTWQDSDTFISRIIYLFLNPQTTIERV